MTHSSTTHAAAPAKGEGPEFLHRLESLRGIAALMVAGWHSLAVLVALGWSAVVIDTIRIFSNGHAAVTLFFVLSGLVLGGSLSRSGGQPWLLYATFAIRRVLRICPAFWVGTCLIAAYMIWIDSPLQYPDFVSRWFAAHWQEPIDWQFFLRNLLFLDHRLNVPSWTLRAELVCSLALPFLFFLSVGRGWRWRAAILLVLILLSFLGRGNLSAWLFMFYLGFLVPTGGRALIGWLKSFPRLCKLVAPLALLLLCLALTILSSLPRWQNLLEGIAAALFISALLYGPELGAYRVLDWRPVRFYGRISYSFYLYHMVCLFVTAKFVLVKIPGDFLSSHVLISGLSLLLFSTCLATLVGWGSQVWVERPGINFSKRLCGLLTRGIAGRPSTDTKRRYDQEPAGKLD
jgi:peptidoglycan/LPS O-acetylase OafA/YrhL